MTGPTRAYGGLGAADDAVRLAPGANPLAAGLSPTEGFVLSRIDGATSLATLCLISGLGEEQTMLVLRRLQQLGLIAIGDRRPVAQPASAPATGVATSAETQRPAAGVATALLDPALVRAVDEDDQAIQLRREQRIEIRALFSRLGELTFFELLGAQVDADAAELRRAYFKQSKVFHPDRHFNKNLGPYKEMLQEIFKQISSAFKFLEDDSRRASYRQTVLQELEQRSLALRVEAQGAEELRQMEEELTDPVLLRQRTPSAEYHFLKQGVPRGRERVALRDKERSDTASYTRVPAAPLPRKAPPEPAPQQGRPRRKTLSAPVTGRLLRARAFFEQGRKQLAEGQAQAAAASLKLALRLHPEDPEFSKLYHLALDQARTSAADNYYKRALYEEEAGRSAVAGKLFVRAAELVPEVSYLLKATDYLLHIRDLIKAKDYVTKAVQRQPNSVQARITLARVHAASGMVEEARQELRHVLRLDPGNPQARELLSQLKH